MPGGVVCGVADVRRGAVAISASTAAIGQYAPAGLASAAFLRVDGVVLVAVSPEGHRAHRRGIDAFGRAVEVDELRALGVARIPRKEDLVEQAPSEWKLSVEWNLGDG